MDMGAYDSAVAALVDKAIKHADLSLLELANRTLIPYAQLHRKVKQGRPFKAAELYVIAHALGVNVGTLYPSDVAA